MRNTDIRNTKMYRNNSIKLLEDNELESYPIDIKKLAENLKLTVNYISLDDDVSGKIEYNQSNNKILITIDKNENEFRQNFSLAHEIAHYIHDIDFEGKSFALEDQRTFLRSNTVNPMEKRANKYAERLLMPKDLFNKRTNEIKKELFPDLDNKLGVKNIYEIIIQLSEDFKVSKPAIIMRLATIQKISPSMKRLLFDYHSY